MKQVLQNLRSGKTYVAEVPVPTPKPGTALVRTTASLVSAGTERMLVEFAEKSLVGKARSRPDLVRQVLDKARREGLLTTVEAAFNRLDQPMPLGYSSAGTIVERGEGLEGFHIGQQVACAGGGYAVHAEYGVVPQNLLTALPEEVDFESGAFATLGAIAMHGFRLSGAQIGEQVAVIGLGLVGLLAVGIAGAAGCRVLGIDLDPKRAQLARDLGAEAVLRDQAESAAKGYTRGRGCDVVLICADTPSSDPIELAGEIARDRARVVATGAVGLHLPRKVYYEKELAFINSRSYGPGRYDPTYEEGGQDYPIGYVRWTEGRNLEAFVVLLASGHLDVHPLITHHYPIERAAQAYELITGKRREPFLGVLLTYPETEDGETSAQKSVIRNAKYLMRNADHALRIPQRASRVALGVLGAGNFASAVMLPALQKVENVELVGVASPSGLGAKNAADRFNFRYAASDENEILDDPAINTIAILTRHHLHAQQIVAALKAGKNVFCEKPLAIKREELDEILEVLQEITQRGDQATADGDHKFHDPEDDPLTTPAHPLLMAGFNRRFAPLAQRMRDFLGDRQEPLMAHFRVNAGYLPPSHWLHDPEQGGGRIIGEGCHFIDFLTFLTGSPPSSVSAGALPDQGHYREDNAVLTFAFPDGSLGTVAYLANGDKSFPKERVEVFCGGRVAVLDDFRSLETIQDGQRKIYRSRLRQDKGHQAEWEAFADAILEGGPPPIPYDHLFAVAQATFAAVEALRSGEKIKLC